MADEIPPVLSEAEFRRLLLLRQGMDPSEIPPILDTATFRRLALESAGGGGGSVVWGGIGGDIYSQDDLIALVNASAAGGPPFNAGNFDTGIDLNFGNGKFQKFTIDDGVLFNPPTSGAEGGVLKVWIFPIGGNQTLDLGDIDLPSDSSITFPKALTGGLRYDALLEFDGSRWSLLSFVGGFPTS